MPKPKGAISTARKSKRKNSKKMGLHDGKLLPQHELFCQNLIKGMTQQAAYLAAGYKCTERSAQANASALLASPKIMAYMAELREKAEKEAVMDVTEKRQTLANIARDAVDMKPVDRMRAIDLDAKLAGHYAPEELNINGSILGQILAKRDD
jgi:hypothetical protein